MKYALALGGGGARGAFEAGVSGACKKNGIALRKREHIGGNCKDYKGIS